MTEVRTEFGARRSTCACGSCRLYCKVMPGALIISDLERMIPKDADPLAWAEENLLASPGALVANSKTGQQTRVPTLVPATKENGHCIYLTDDEQCSIHTNSPFYCCMFSCFTSDKKAHNLSVQGIQQVANDFANQGLYSKIWLHLAALGKVSDSPDEKRKRYNEAIS